MRGYRVSQEKHPLRSEEPSKHSAYISLIPLTVVSAGNRFDDLQDAVATPHCTANS